MTGKATSILSVLSLLPLAACGSGGDDTVPDVSDAEAEGEVGHEDGSDADADPGAEDVVFPDDGACPAPFLSCDGTCTDPAVDPGNCGACGTRCEASEWCAASDCGCRPGLTLCGANCVDTNTDPDNCGGCSNSCGGANRCADRSCGSTCPSGTQSCSNACVDVERDPANCGECGTACAVDEVCAAGACRTFTPATGCSACPCDICGSGLCCTYPGATLVVCLDATVCP